MIAYRAQWIVSVSAPPIRDGVLAIDGERIVQVGPASDFSGHELHNLGDIALLPGFINAHTHFELCHLQQQIRRAPFWDWIEQIVASSRDPQDPQRRRESVAAGAAQSLAAGVTCVGDISRTGLNVIILALSPIRKVCFLELISAAQSPPNNIALLNSIFNVHIPLQSDRLRLGISPHAPYTVHAPDLADCVELAVRNKCPLTMHYLETAEEFGWITQDATTMSRYIHKHGLPVFSARRYPPHFLAALGMQRCRPLLAHVNYIDAEHLAELDDIGASVAWCPRTHHYFGHPPHPWREMLARGVNVCIGTDSLASNPSLSILDELRFVHAESRDVSPATLLEMGTLRAACALHWEDQLGSLATGKFADFVSVPIPRECDDPVRAILGDNSPPAQVWIAGQLVHSA